MGNVHDTFYHLIDQRMMAGSEKQTILILCFFSQEMNIFKSHFPPLFFFFPFFYQHFSRCYQIKFFFSKKKITPLLSFSLLYKAIHRASFSEEKNRSYICLFKRLSHANTRAVFFFGKRCSVDCFVSPPRSPSRCSAAAADSSSAHAGVVRP